MPAMALLSPVSSSLGAIVADLACGHVGIRRRATTADLELLDLFLDSRQVLDHRVDVMAVALLLDAAHPRRDVHHEFLVGLNLVLMDVELQHIHGVLHSDALGPRHRHGGVSLRDALAQLMELPLDHVEVVFDVVLVGRLESLEVQSTLIRSGRVGTELGA